MIPLISLKKEKKRKNPLCRILHSKRGYTLVEGIVSMVLLSILMSVGVQTVTVFTGIYIRVNSIEKAHSVASILMDTISGELSRTTIAPKIHADGEEKSFGEEGDTITYRNADGRMIIMSLDQYDASVTPDSTGKVTNQIITPQTGELHLFYQYAAAGSSGGTDGDGTGADTVGRAVDWYFSSNVYMGNVITGLTFTRLDSSTSKTRIQVTLELKNTKTQYTYSTTQIIECYNLLGGA